MSTIISGQVYSIEYIISLINENAILKDKLSIYERKDRQYDLLLQNNDSLKEEIELLKKENEELKKKLKEKDEELLILKTKIDTIEKERLEEKTSRDYENYLSDVFRYYRDRILMDKLDEIECKMFTTQHDVISCLRRKNPSKSSSAKEIIKSTGVEPEVVMTLAKLNSERNDKTHFIDSDKEDVKDELYDFKLRTKSLNSKSHFYKYQKDILKFVDTLI